ncbi:MAG TPA: HAMP domain-containing protein [Bacteroidetes bacterium]|nr:HAMP domain-containing protein [Bacteroidota bacterium]
MMVFNRLRTRIIMHIIWIVSTVTVATFFFVDNLHQESLRKHLKDDAISASQIVRNMLVHVMHERKPDLLNDLLPEISQLHHIKTIRLIEPGGTITFSSQPQEVETHADTAGLSRFLAMSGSTLVSSGLQGENLLIKEWMKLPNEEKCQSCHDDGEPLNGVLLIETADTVSLRVVNPNYLAIAGVSFGIILLMSLVTSMLFVRSIDRPIRKIKRAMQAIEQGDFSVRIDIPQRDEIGVLAQGINTLAERLEASRKQLMENHEREIRQTEALAKAGKLAAGLAHEIKNPISGIVFAINSILRETDGCESHREIFREIARQANRVEQNLEVLLSLARQSRFEARPADVQKIIEQVLLFIGQQNNGRKLKIEFERCEELPEIMADPNQLEQLFLNLIINAVQAMPEGGYLRICTEHLAEQKKIRITIQDTGTGIPKHVQPNIFQPFFTTKTRGVGLGLTICHDIVTRHHGTITFTSRPGAGTTFFIELDAERKVTLNSVGDSHE